MRANVDKSFHSQDDGLTIVNLVGGVVIGTANNNLVWVVAAKPSQLKDGSDETQIRGWGISYDDIKDLSSVDGQQEVEVIENVETIRLTAAERFSKLVDSNIFLYDNPFGPNGGSAPGFGGPC